jgi:tRNA (guanine-N7-)-methyltransferase
VTVDDAADNVADDTTHHRRIRSFVTRAGRLSPAQQRAIETLGDRFIVPYAPMPLDARALFGRTAPLVVEIGFGMGATTAEIAAARRDVDFVGIEVHEPGIGALLKLVESEQLDNVRVIAHDAVDVVAHMIAPDSLAGVHVFFPDPWPKARHHKRRLLQPAFVSLLASRLAHGAYLHCATDWEHYAEQMREVLDGEASLVADEPVNPIAPRPETKFETRGKRLGHGVWDFVYRRGR